MVLENKAFGKMHSLRLLKLSGVLLSGTYEAFPKRIRWLYWRGFPSRSFPNGFPMEYLVALDMRYSNLKRLWKRTKILQEGSIFSTYFPGREVPHWFSNRNSGSTVSLTMTSSSPHCGFPGLNLCLVYTVPGDLDCLPEPLQVEVSNKSRGMKRVYTPRCYGIPEAGGDMVWLSHWLPLPGMTIFEEGDELQVLFNLKVEGQIKECGVHILYFREDEMGKYFSTIYHSWDSNMFRVVALEEATEAEAETEEGEGGGATAEDAEEEETKVKLQLQLTMETEAQLTCDIQSKEATTS